MVISVPKREALRVYTLRADKTLKVVKNLFKLSGWMEETLSKVVLSTALLTSLVKHATPQKVSLEINLKGYRFYSEGDGYGRVRALWEGSKEEGTLKVVREVGTGKPYLSVVNLISEEVEENLNHYFKQSEQTLTYVKLIYNGERGRGILVQSMGGVREESFERIRERVLELKDEPLSLRPEELSSLILRGEEPLLVGLKEVEYYCPCNEEIAKSSLLMLSDQEVRELLRKKSYKLH